MRALIHCPWCHSKTTFHTDGSGGLVERLNHPCACPQIDRRVRVELPPVKEQVRRKRFCIDCGVEVSGWAKRCVEHSKLHKRKVTLAAQRMKRLQASGR